MQALYCLSWLPVLSDLLHVFRIPGSDRIKK
nr:MAG TPA_asm: hypothetical protein [Caudoviricetes sp.]